MRLATAPGARENVKMTDLHALDTPQQWTDRLVAVLRRRAGRHLAAAEAQAGVRPGYLRKAQSASGNVMLRKFLAICEAADIDPGDVFHEVFPKSDLDPDFGLPVPNIPLPKIAKQAQRRAGEAPQRPAPGADWLEWLDTLRYDDPRRALKTAEAAVNAVEPEHLTWLLGIWASACRPLCKHGEAFLVLREALRISRVGEDRLAEADTLQRCAALVVSASADYRVALRINERAIAYYATSARKDVMGQALVSQGIYLVYLERYLEADTAFHTAKDLLTQQSPRHLFSLFHAMGWSSKEQGRDLEALQYCYLAQQFLATDNQLGKLQWLEASVLAAQGRWGEARRAFSQSLGRLIETSPVDAAIVACDQVQLLLRSGLLGEARARILAMRRFTGPLSRNIVACAAIRDLIRSEQEGKQLTTKLVFRISQRIEESRRARTRRLG